MQRSKKITKIAKLNYLMKDSLIVALLTNFHTINSIDKLYYFPKLSAKALKI